MTSLRDARWIGWLTKVTIYPARANLHQKIAVLAAPILGSSGSRGVSFLANSQATEVNLTQGVQDNLRHLLLKKQKHFPVKL